MARTAGIDKDLLAMALVGYQAEIKRIEVAMAELKARMGGQPASVPAPNAPGKRTLSASARRKIAAAQKKRWAALKKSEATTPEKPKRKMSAAARKRIGDATRKRWADLRKAKGKKGAKHPIARLNGGGGAGGAGGGGSKP